MLNYTLSGETFQKGIQQLLGERQYKTFTQDDIWSSLTEQAGMDDTLPEPSTVNHIAESWLKKERLPVVKITRDYEKNSAEAEQVTTAESFIFAFLLFHRFFYVCPTLLLALLNNTMTTVFGPTCGTSTWTDYCPRTIESSMIASRATPKIICDKCFNSFILTGGLNTVLCRVYLERAFGFVVVISIVHVKSLKLFIFFL